LKTLELHGTIRPEDENREDQGMTIRPNLVKASRHISELKDATFAPLPFKPISADSHITEPPNCYKEYIDPKYRDSAPHMEIGPNGGSVYVIDGVNDGKPMTIGMAGLSAAGVDPREIKTDSWKFEDLHKGGHIGKERVAAQDKDGVGGEVIFPSVGMVLCNHPDPQFKSACFQAYNRWLQEFQSAAPDRIFGLGQSAVAGVKETIADLERIKEMGFVGAMFPCEPSMEMEYDDPAMDPVWEAASALKLPITFHILTSKRDAKLASDVQKRGGNNVAHFHHTLIRANQDVICQFIWGRVFERFPNLKIVCAEADAGWVPHFMYRLDHYYHRHRFWSKVEDMQKLPSEHFSDNVYMTFQDDLIALNSLDMLNPKRLMWANDYPHSDSTWPWSQQLLSHQTAHMTEDERRSILRDNVVELFNLRVN